MAEQRHISVPKPFSSGDVSEWLRRFEICSKANKWNEETQALKLPTLLEGEALAVWLELSEEEQSSMETIKRKLKEKMMPMKFISLGQFHARKLHPGEPLSVFTHDLKQLLEQAVPDLTDDTAKGQLLLHQFLAGIPEAVSRQIRASGEVQDLEKAVERARLLMTVNETSDMGSVQAAAIDESRPTDSVTKKLEEQVAKLTEQVAALSARTPQGSGRQRQRPRYLRCFKCNRVGHTQYECSYEHQMQTPAGNRRCFACGRFGHIARDCHPQGNQWAQGPSYQQQGNDQGMSVWGNRHPRQQ